MHSKSRKLLVTLFLAGSFGVAAQQYNEDSLQRILHAGKVSGKDMLVYRALGINHYSKGNYDSAIYYYKEGLQRSLQLKNKYWETKYTLWTGGVYIAATKYDSAEHYLSLSYPLVQESKNDSLIASYHQNTGTLYLFQNKHEASAEAMIKSIDIMEKMGDKTPSSLLMAAYANLSAIFSRLNQLDKALEYDKKMLALKEAYANTGEYASLYFNAAVTYFQLEDFKNMKLYLDTALYYNNLYPNPRALLNIIGSLGTYYENTGQKDSALVYHERAMAISKEAKEFYFYAERAINAAGVYSQTGNQTKAAALLKEAIPYAEQFSDYRMLAEAYKGLKEIAQKKGNFKDAFQYAELSNAYYDSVSNATVKTTVLDLETKYEATKKEKEIADLTASNTQKDLAVVKRNRFLIIGCISSAALLLTLGLLYRNSRQKKSLAEKDKRLKEEEVKFLKEQQQVISLQSMVNGQETERTRIAKDLHDSLGGLFSTIKMYFSSMQHEHPALMQNEIFNKSLDLVNNASQEVRRIAHNMMPEVLIKVGLVQAVQDLCDNINSSKLLTISLQHYGMGKRLNASTEVMLFRIIQELLNNIIKHASASKTIVQFNRIDNELTVTVEDNGKGFNLQETDNKTHAGLETVKSRVNYLNGELSIDTEKEVGTTVIMHFLINEE